MEMTLLDVEGIRKSFGGRTVVNSVSFSVAEGEIVGLLGPNGAGKTTSFKMIVGILTPEAGTVHFKGEDITKLPMYRRARKGMGYLSQEASVFQHMTVRQNILAVLEARGVRRKEREEKTNDILEEFGLSHVANNKAHSLSGGERRRLEIARSLATSPSLLLLDEPFSGVDPIAVSSLQELIRNLSGRGIGILLTDHSVRETLKVTDSAYIIRDGNILVHGSSDYLINDHDAREHYLGHDFKM
jgi:lipopolysaccharide export system ATP-binding protein